MATDPCGNPLHECEWSRADSGIPSLVRARVRLDWGAWVGLVPSGIVNETSLNLATRPGWQRLTGDDLRAMAAQALRVPLDEVRWFYRDEDLVIAPDGRATIRHRKDAFYWLEDGDFRCARFMSCMGAMHWANVDFLPVVELFKSLLPGTGSAVFELIRGLYDDQNEGNPHPRPIRYRGIPTYPSEAAFRLFSGFFKPMTRDACEPLALFMDQEKAHQVEWLPAPIQPHRYFDMASGSCLTLHGDVLQKVTVMRDPAGLSYFNPKGRRFVPFDRSAEIVNGRVVLRDRDRETVLTIPVPQGCREGPKQSFPLSPVDWRTLFVKGVQTMSPQEAYSAVLLYPQDESEISELSAQPFVADYLQDVAEQDRDVGMVVARANRVLIDNGDAVVATCIPFDRPRDVTVIVRAQAFAQRQAQQLWTQCAELDRWDWLSRIRFVHAGKDSAPVGSNDGYDLIYDWVPYLLEGDLPALMSRIHALQEKLREGGYAFIVGPLGLGTTWKVAGLSVCWQEAVEQLPTFRMHRTMLPKARLKDGLTLYCVKKV